MKNSEVVSQIINDLRALSIDDRVSPRYVLAKAVANASLFIKRENDQLRLWNYIDLWTTIDCIEMVPANIKECCNISIDKCKFIMRSKHKLPGLFSYKNGPLIREVMSMDGNTIYYQTTPQSYKDILNREFVDKRLRYFWIENGYVIIPDSQVQMISLTGFFQNNYEAKKLNSCNTSEEETCPDPLEQEFTCPPHLIQVVLEATTANLFNFYKRVVVDELPEGDNNKKTGL